MKARYIRVSTRNQKIERQLKLKHPDELLFMDIVSGSVAFEKRVKGQELLKEVKSQAVSYISVHSIDRLGRNLYDILKTIKTLEEHNITLKVDNLGIENSINGKSNFAFKLIISVMGSIAEMERETMLERQREGILVAKAKGVYKGRVKGSKESKGQFLLKHKTIIKYLNKNYSLRIVAKLTNTSLSTVQKVKRIYYDQQTPTN